MKVSIYDLYIGNRIDVGRWERKKKEYWGGLVNKWRSNFCVQRDVTRSCRRSMNGLNPRGRGCRKCALGTTFQSSTWDATRERGL